MNFEFYNDWHSPRIATKCKNDLCGEPGNPVSIWTETEVRVCGYCGFKTLHENGIHPSPSDVLQERLDKRRFFKGIDD